ncbi:MAG: hypothetical protein ACP5NW_01260 [Candidatus Woesearchaeota archaeon]
MKNTNISDIVNKTFKKSIEKLGKAYDKAYASYPIITNYLSSAIGTVGGDIIAKQFTENPHIKPRDILFTASAAAAYSYLAPKMIEWSKKSVDKLGKYWHHIKNNKVTHTMTNTVLLTAMYFPVNMLYWNYLTIKNQAPIAIEDNIAGAITLGIATIPYLAADYVAIKRFSQPKTQKYLRPFYSGVEIVWNTLFAGGNYIAKKH